jgi:radical SAM superfamily enzyme YgiQ (UPF0313 family)
MLNNVFLVSPANVSVNFIGEKQFNGIPLSLIYLAGSIKNICDRVDYFDFNVKRNTLELFEEKLIDLKPVCVGVNCLFSGLFKETLEICKFVKKTLPQANVVIGGIHPTIFAQEIMENCECIDAVVLGEGEKAFPLLLKEYLSNQDCININNLDSIVIRVGGGGVITIPKSNYIENLDSIKPDYEPLCLKDYERNTEKWFDPNNIKISAVQMPILTSRSCPNSCNFCSMRFVMGNKIRFRSAENVFNELKMLYEIYGINYFKIMDDNFAYNKKRTLEICDMIIRNNLKIAMEFTNGLMVKTLDKEVVDALCMAGASIFCLAIESGSDYIRNTIMRKNCSKEFIFEVIQNLREHNVCIYALFMIGLPEETAETIDDTTNMITDLFVEHISISIVNPFPGTALYNQCKRDNLFTSKFDENNLWNNSLETYDSTVKDIGAGLNFFPIKPYNLSLEILVKKYTDLCTLINIKNQKWNDHIAIQKK